MPTVKTTTVLARLREHAEGRPTAPAYTFLTDNGDTDRILTFADVERMTRAVAAALRGRLRPGDRALLLLTEGFDFIPTFLGCLQAGVIAVPAYPPLPVQSRRRMETLRAIVNDCQPSVVVTEAGADVAATVRGGLPELADAWWASAHAVTTAPPADRSDNDVEPETIAFLQYTSGSTSLPKGVVVTHGALAHNEEMIQHSFEHHDGVTVVSWLPLFHDMGLIGNVLQPLWMGGCAVLMPPMAFIKRPARWLRAISRYRATTSGGPNFGYDMCTRRMSDDECTGLDLSSWKVAFNGAEPVRPDTLRGFTERFASYGFNPTAWYPCYGLAEATLLVTGSRVTVAPSQITVDRDALHDGKVTPSDTGKTLVSAGISRLDREVLIVNPDSGEPVAPDRVGEIWIGGPGLPTRYWANAEDTERTFAARPVRGGEGPYLRSGDLGFIRDGELYVTGRCKDVIIVGGLNHYPQDIEATVEDTHKAIRSGCSVAFSVDDGETERLIVVVGVGNGIMDTSDAAARKRAEIIKMVRAAVASAHRITVDDVVPVGPQAVPKTSSGKLQRGACRAAYLSGEYA
ncbi:MAG: fatty acyl-AMP ligase [Pseudonocardiaceae bacterium]